MEKQIKKGFYIGLCFLAFFLFYRSVLGQGTCASPDGAMLLRATVPADYAELEADGNCINGTGATNWHFMCFTFTPNSSSIEINAGYNTSCNNGAFRSFILYDNLCAIAGTGLVYTGLTTSSEYTFCIEMRANGGPSCDGFDRICPYYEENTVLPVKMLDMHCDSGRLTWITASEINNQYFSIYSSSNIDTWEYKLDMAGAGTKNTKTVYSYYDASCMDDTYYKIDQTDFDGRTSFEGIVLCDCKIDHTPEYIIEEYNILGQVFDGKGLKIIKIMRGDQVIYKKIFTQ